MAYQCSAWILGCGCEFVYRALVGRIENVRLLFEYDLVSSYGCRWSGGKVPDDVEHEWGERTGRAGLDGDANGHPISILIAIH